MAYTEEYLNYISDQLSGVKDITSKKMFGGVGFFNEGKMFGLLTKSNVFHLKVDDSNREDYTDKNMEQFNPKKKGKGMPYYEVPVEILENKKELKKWTTKSINIALGKT